jgi:GNAT superfamily N-acetyltransferase
MNISVAHPAEAAVLTEIAFAAKRHWGYPERWIAQWHALLTITPASIAENETFAARLGGRTLGFAALKLDGEILVLNDLWVVPAEMGRGIGRALFRDAQQRARARGFATFEIESDPHAAGFYERMGAEYLRTHTTLIEGLPRELPVFVCRTS